MNFAMENLFKIKAKDSKISSPNKELERITHNLFSPISDGHIVLVVVA